MSEWTPTDAEIMEAIRQANGVFAPTFFSGKREARLSIGELRAVYGWLREVERSAIKSLTNTEQP